MVTAVPSAAPTATVLTIVFTDVVDLVLMSCCVESVWASCDRSRRARARARLVRRWDRARGCDGVGGVRGGPLSRRLNRRPVRFPSLRIARANFGRFRLSENKNVAGLRATRAARISDGSVCPKTKCRGARISDGSVCPKTKNVAGLRATRAARKRPFPFARKYEMSWNCITIRAGCEIKHSMRGCVRVRRKRRAICEWRFFTRRFRRAGL